LCELQAGRSDDRGYVLSNMRCCGRPLRVSSSGGVGQDTDRPLSRAATIRLFWRFPDRRDPDQQWMWHNRECHDRSRLQDIPWGFTPVGLCRHLQNLSTYGSHSSRHLHSELDPKVQGVREIVPNNQAIVGDHQRRPWLQGQSAHATGAQYGTATAMHPTAAKAGQGSANQPRCTTTSGGSFRSSQDEHIQHDGVTAEE